MGAGHSEGTLPRLGHEAWRVQGRVGGLGARRRVVLGGHRAASGSVCVCVCMRGALVPGALRRSTGVG